MQILFRILLSLAFSLPVASVFAGILWVLIYHYDQVYGILLGPILMLFALILGAYSLSLIFLNYSTLRREGWQAAFSQHVRMPFTQVLPVMALIGLAAWAWIFFALVPIGLLVPNAIPEGVLFLIAFLLLVKELFKIQNRSTILTKRLDPTQAPPGEPPIEYRWNRRMLGFMVYAQSALFLLANWAGLLLLLWVFRQLTQAWMNESLREILNLALMAAWLYVADRGEKRAERFGREQLYLPWKSGY